CLARARRDLARRATARAAYRMRGSSSRNRAASRTFQSARRGADDRVCQRSASRDRRSTGRMRRRAPRARATGARAARHDPTYRASANRRTRLLAFRSPGLSALARASGGGLGEGWFGGLGHGEVTLPTLVLELEM